MKKELKKPLKEISELRVKTYAGEACVDGDGNTDVNVSGSGCKFTNGLCIDIDIFCFF